MITHRSLARAFTLVAIPAVGCTPTVHAPKASEAAISTTSVPEPTTEAPTTSTTVTATTQGTVVVFEAAPPVTDQQWWADQPGYDGTLPLPPGSVKECESHGDYGAVNSSSGAGGAWQFLPSTWNGYGGYSRAEAAPPAVQDAKAAELWDNGNGASHWRACL